MFARLFLVAAALLPCWSVELYDTEEEDTGGASENSVSGKILAFAGETVILPCLIDVRDDIPTVEWVKEGLDPDIAFLYRDGCETYEMKNPAFQYRTNLFMNELKNGNISLRISDVQLPDAGKYVCKVIRKPPWEVATMELIVGAVSEPKLSVVPAVDGGVTLQCEANCWFPEPEITFLDERGNNISAGDPKSDLDSQGCFTVTRRVAVQNASNRVTCRVHQSNINQARVTDIYIPADCMRSCTLFTTIAVLVAIILCAIIAISCKIYGNFVGGRKALASRQSSDQSTTHSNADVHPQRNQADNDGNTATEQQRKIEELMLRLDDKEEINRRLTEELNELRSKQSPVVCQHGRPTFDNSPSISSPDVSQPFNLPPHQFPHRDRAKPVASTNSNRPKSGNVPQKKDSKPGASIQIPAPGSQIRTGSHSHSSPALSTDNVAVLPSSSSALSSEKWHVVRSMSLSGPRQNSARPPRRNTISALSHNPFSVLQHVPEDSELLLPLERS